MTLKTWRGAVETALYGLVRRALVFTMQQRCSECGAEPQKWCSTKNAIPHALRLRLGVRATLKAYAHEVFEEEEQ